MGNLNPNKIIFEEPEERDFVTFPKGVYRFRIIEINEIKLSRENQSPYVPIKIECSRPSTGESTTVYDNIVLTDAAKWKLDAFLKCLCGDTISRGKEIDLEDPAFISWVKRREGSVRLKVTRPPGKDYDRNEVETYVYKKEEERPKDPPPAPPSEEDDIPF